MLQAAIGPEHPKFKELLAIVIFKRAATRMELGTQIEELKERLAALEEQLEPGRSLLRAQHPTTAKPGTSCSRTGSARNGR